jgi:tryptophan-rich sensory protein
MGYAAYRVFYLSQDRSTTSMVLYGGQLALNFIWTPLFFRLKWFGWSLIDLVTLWGMTAGTAWQFYKIDALSGKLFVPYLAWTTLASSLNWYIWANNPSGFTGRRGYSDSSDISPRKTKKNQ